MKLRLLFRIMLRINGLLRYVEGKIVVFQLVGKMVLVFYRCGPDH